MTIPYTNKVIRLEKIDEIVAFVNKKITSIFASDLFLH